MTRARFKNSQSGQMLIMLIILVVITGSIMLVGGFNLPKTKPYGDSFTPNITPDASSSARENLQLQPITFSIPEPACGYDDYVCHHFSEKACCPDIPVFCSKGKCVGTSQIGGSGNAPTSNQCPWGDAPCSGCGNEDGYTCIGKPVIYLYPVQTTKVNVSIQIPGKIVVSDPEYPSDGWKNVEAHPDGILIYEGRTYKELFYESRVGDFLKPTNGIIIAKSELGPKLKELVFQLGLNETESQEFLDFWVPKLNKLNSKYILFSLVDKGTKERIDHVTILPEPDTRIEFIAYFKPLSTPNAIEPLIIPQRPERRGFTSVEWGGAIDNNSNLLE